MLNVRSGRAPEPEILAACGDEPADDELLNSMLVEAHRELDRARRHGQVILANARIEASEICQRARLEATRLIEAARAQAEEAAAARRQEIEEEARRRAHEEGLAAANAQAGDALALAEQLRRHLEAAYRAHLAEAEHGILETVLAIAERVVSIQQDEFREVLGSAVRGVLAEASEASEVTLALNPGDYDTVAAYLRQHGEAFGRVENIVASAAVQPGCCKFRSAGFNLDLSLPRRFDLVRAHLRRQLDVATCAS